MPKAKGPKLDFAAARAFATRHLPGVEVTEKFGNASFSIAGKVFAFTRPNGLVLKLPPDALATLIATREAQHLVMGKRVMREWAMLVLPTRGSYVDEIPLIKSAMSFVESLRERG